MSNEIEYIDTSLIIKSFFDKINYEGTIEDFYKIVSNQKVSITPDEIKCFLNKRFEQDEPIIYKRMSKYNITKSDPTIWTEEEIIKDSDKYFDLLVYQKYQYDSNTYDFVTEYYEVIKTRFINMLNLVNNITTIDSVELLKYDIVLSKDKKIKPSDFSRLLDALIEIYDENNEYLNKVNNPKYYLLFPSDIKYKISNPEKRKELFPSRELQIFSDDVNKGYIRLSDNQKNLLDCINYNVKIK